MNTPAVNFDLIIRPQSDGYIPIKPTCETFRMSHDYQVSKIKKDIVLNQLHKKIKVTGADGKTYKMFCLTKRGYFRWIDRLNSNVLPQEFREIFTYFQQNMDAYFLKLEGDVRNYKDAFNDLQLHQKLRAKYKKHKYFVDKRIQEEDAIINCLIINGPPMPQLPFSESKQLTA